MTRFSVESQNYHNFKVLVTIKDIFDIYNCNGTFFFFQVHRHPQCDPDSYLSVYEATSLLL